MTEIEKILKKDNFIKEDLLILLSASKVDSKFIFDKAAKIKKDYVGNKVYLRGLIELSNKCAKNCYYCGIRTGNSKLDKYELSEDEVIEAVDFAYKNKYASLVIQSGERSNKKFVNSILKILKNIQALVANERQPALAITLSLGEQNEETYKQWFDAGAKRYLLRIETSDRELYYKIHPDNKKHSYDKRLECIKSLKKIGYQVGTGVMIGLPFQTIENLAGDLMFFKEIDIDMCGMGPYIEHKDTPLYKYRESLFSKEERFLLSLKMVALLRIMMKDINIAATTAMQTLDPQGREKAIKVGANVIMPNLTPVKYRENYLLYEDKPCFNELRIENGEWRMAGDEIAFGEQGTSKHYKSRKTLNSK